MKNIVIILMAAALFAGCDININIHPDLDKDNGPAVSRTFPLADSYRILEVSHAFDVTMCDTVSVPVVTLDSSLFDNLVFSVENRTLKIGFKPGSYNNIQVAHVLLPYNEQLRKVELSGASHFTSNHPLGNDLAKLELSGASAFNGDLAAGKVEIELCGASEYSGSLNAGNVDLDFSGASTATITGTCSNMLEIDLSGASHLDARDLDAVHVKGELSGASSANVLCCESLRMDLGGASHLTYATIADGCEPDVNCSTSGGSTVRSRY